jgi:hypothetical protein
MRGYIDILRSDVGIVMRCGVLGDIRKDEQHRLGCEMDLRPSLWLLSYGHWCQAAIAPLLQHARCTGQRQSKLHQVHKTANDSTTVPEQNMWG